MSKIVVTGYGIKAPKTNNVDQFLVHLQNGECCLEQVADLGSKNETCIVGVINK